MGAIKKTYIEITLNTNKMANLDLLQQAMLITKKNLVKSTNSRKSINNYLLEALKEGPKTRLELVNSITLERLKDSEDSEITNKSFEDQEFLERFVKMNTTCKNGVDTSISRGKAKSCFHNKFEGQYDIELNEDKKYQLIEL